MLQPLRQLGVLARATLLEAIRNRLLLVALAFAVVLVGLSVAAASVAIGERVRLIIDVGLAAASAFGTIIAVALTISSVAGELVRHTAYPVLARPVSRTTFIVGKYLGLVATMALVVTLMVLATAGVATLYGGPVPAALWASLPLTIVETSVVVAVSLLFASFASPALAATYTAGVVLAGNLTADIVEIAARFAARTGDFTPLLRAAYYLLPDLAKLSVRTQAANALPVGTATLAWGVVYGAAYAATAVLIAALVFGRRRSV